MKGLMVVLIIAAGCLATLIGFYPFPVTATTVAMEYHVSGECYANGVCCYSGSYQQNLSCVSTKIEIVVKPGVVNGAYERERSPAYGGEVSSRALEGRFSRQLIDRAIGGN